jgi:hypothetical protein
MPNKKKKEHEFITSRKNRRETSRKRATEFESKDSEEVRDLKKRLAFAEDNWREYKGLLQGALIALEDAKKVIEDGQKGIAELESRDEPKARVTKKKGR